MRKLLPLVAMSIASVISCATAPSFIYQQLDHKREFDGSYDDVWEATTQAVLNHPDNVKIDEIDKDSGVLTTETKYGSTFAEGVMDCGINPAYINTGIRFAYTYAVRDYSNDTVQVRIKTNAAVLRSSFIDGSERWFPCFSKGVIEPHMLNAIGLELDEILLIRSMD